MSHRRAAIAVATSLVAAGVIPLTLSLANAAAACPSWSDPKGDSGPQPPAPAVSQANDPALDLLGAAWTVTDTDVVVKLKIDKLGARSTYSPGHSFYLDFMVGTTGYYFDTEVFGTSPASLTVNGVYTSADDTKVATTVPTFDTTASVVSIAVKKSAVPGLATGKVSGFSAYTGQNYLMVPYWDRANAPAGLAFEMVDGACDFAGFPSAPAPTGTGTPTGSPSPTGTPAPTGSPSPSPTGTPPAVPASKLANAGAVSSQYGDVASVAAKLTNASGAALVGKTVTFKLAGKTGSAKTNSAGVASAKLALASNASAQTLVASFAGDSSAKASSVSTKFTITTEKTKITMVTAKSGTARTVTATLLEDDNRALGSQKLVVYVNGAKKTTLTTDAKGKVVYKAAKAGQTVKFAFAAVSGKWAASSVQQKLS